MMSLLCDAEEWLIFNEGREISYKICPREQVKVKTERWKIRPCA